jgi:hypothetical protein
VAVEEEAIERVAFWEAVSKGLLLFLLVFLLVLPTVK